MIHIGQRTTKSAIAVFICLLIGLFRTNTEPFYSAIAAILCMQPYFSNSLDVAKNRILGTFIGGIAGIFILAFELTFIPQAYIAFQYVIIALCIVILITLDVYIKKSNASYITCVVFLSVTVSHGMDINPFLFGWNRMLDTLIGIGVSLAVNSFRLPKKKNGKMLFVSNLDGTLLNESQHLSSYSLIRLNRLIEDGAHFTISTARTPATLHPILEGLSLNLPLIVMNGAAFYDLKEHRYTNCKYIDASITKEIMTLFVHYGLNCFAHYLINDILHIYYTALNNPAEEHLYHKMKDLPLKNYICAQAPEDRDAIYLTCVDNEYIIKHIYHQLRSQHYFKYIGMVYYADTNHDGYYFLEIFHKESTQENAISTLKNQINANTVVTFANDLKDIPMLKNADYGFAVENAKPQVREAADHTIGSNNTDSVVKTIEKIYYNKRSAHLMD